MPSRPFINRSASQPGREIVIHNGVAPAEFKPVALDADAKDFVFIGEFRDVKGILVLIDASNPCQGAMSGARLPSRWRGRSRLRPG